MIIELEKNDVEKIEELKKLFPNVLKDIQQDIKNNPYSNYLLYIINDSILGFLNYYLIYDRIEIADFNVLEEYQNRKIGTKLLDYLINNFSYDNITLEVRCDNNIAIHLYKKMGFKVVAIRKGYYQGIDGMLMERK